MERGNTITHIHYIHINVIIDCEDDFNNDDVILSYWPALEQVL